MGKPVAEEEDAPHGDAYEWVLKLSQEIAFQCSTPKLKIDLEKRKSRSSALECIIVVVSADARVEEESCWEASTAEGLITSLWDFATW